MHNAKDQHVLVLDAVHNNVLAYRKAAKPSAEVVNAGASKVRKTRKCYEALGNRIDEEIGDLQAPTFLRDVIPDIVKISFGAWSETVRHQ